MATQQHTYDLTGSACQQAWRVQYHCTTPQVLQVQRTLAGYGMCCIRHLSTATDSPPAKTTSMAPAASLKVLLAQPPSKGTRCNTQCYHHHHFSTPCRAFDTVQLAAKDPCTHTRSPCCQTRQSSVRNDKPRMPCTMQRVVLHADCCARQAYMHAAASEAQAASAGETRLTAC